MSRAVVFLLVALPALSAPLVAQTPAVYFSPTEIDTARDRASRHPWARAALGKINSDHTPAV